MSDTQPTDHSFKSMTDRDPEGTVRELGGLGWDVPIEVHLIRTSASVRVDSDQLFEVRIEGRETRLYHFESETNFDSHDGRVALRHAVVTAVARDTRIRPVLVLHNPRRAAMAYNPHQQLDYDGIVVNCKFHIARLWTLPPDNILGRNRIHLMPMVMGMRSTPEQIREASLRIEMVESEPERRRLFQEMVTFGAPLYDKDEIESLLGRISRKMLPPMEVVRESDIGQRIEEIGRFAGRQEGIAAGRHEGEIAGLRKAVQCLVTSWCPDQEPPDSALPSTEDELRHLLTRLASARTPEQFRRILDGQVN